MVKPGISMNSWCTMPIPFVMASIGDRMRTGSPSSFTSPLNPPVEWITGMPNRTFMSVDFPAPFSPSSAWISPGRMRSVTSFRTAFDPYSLVM